MSYYFKHHVPHWKQTRPARNRQLVPLHVKRHWHPKNLLLPKLLEVLLVDLHPSAPICVVI